MATTIKKITATNSRVIISRQMVKVTLIIPTRLETTVEINSENQRLKTMTIVINPGASLNLIQNFSTGTPRELTERIVVGRRATLSYVMLHKLSAVSNFSCVIEHHGAACSTIRLALSGKNQAKNSTSLVSKLDAAESQSKILILASARDEAKLTINANAAISRQAESAVADVGLHSLLLSPQAAIELTPKMEIKNSNVIAAHRATVSQLDQLEKFYLNSRGLTAQETELLLVNNFFTQLTKDLNPQLITRIIPALKTL